MAISRGSHEILDRLFNALWREGLNAGRRLSGDGKRAVVRLDDQSELLAHVEHVRALDRLRTRAPYVLRKAGEGRLEELATPAQAIDRLQALSTEEGLDWRQLDLELTQSAHNLDLFFSHAPARVAELIARGTDKILALGDVPLETWNLRGHELHPGCKTRFGWTDVDLRQYSPELGCTLDLNFVALRQDHAVDTRIADAELPWPIDAPDGFLVLAVHPWQLEHKLRPLFQDEFARGILQELPDRHPVTPLASLRTVVPLGASHHLKLPLAVQSTSALRTVSPQSAQNGPRLSELLGNLPFLSLQAEERGIHFWREGEDLDRARHLSLIYRQAPKQIAGTHLVPCAVLSEPSPLDGLPMVAEAAHDPIDWIARYTELTASTVLPALFEYGIALEAHGQNSLVRLERDQPVELILRDLGGIRIYFPWLHARGLDVRLHPESVVIAHTPEELVAKSHHTYVQGNLAPVVSALAEARGLNERLLWKAVSQTMRRMWRWGDEAARLWFAPSIQVKALTRMRLGGRSHQYDFCSVKSPLA